MPVALWFDCSLEEPNSSEVPNRDFGISGLSGRSKFLLPQKNEKSKARRRRGKKKEVQRDSQTDLRKFRQVRAFVRGLPQSSRRCSCSRRIPPCVNVAIT